jgi:hypothetical protein
MFRNTEQITVAICIYIKTNIYFYNLESKKPFLLLEQQLTAKCLT